MSALANMTLVKLNLSRTSAGILTSQGCGREVRCSLWECFEALVVTAVLLLHCHYEVEPVAASQPRTRVREYISLVKASVSITCQPHTYFSTLLLPVFLFTSDRKHVSGADVGMLSPHVCVIPGASAETQMSYGQQKESCHISKSWDRWKEVPKYAALFPFMLVSVRSTLFLVTLVLDSAGGNGKD